MLARAVAAQFIAQSLDGDIAAIEQRD